jgi:four helix bundle protein
MKHEDMKHEEGGEGCDHARDYDAWVEQVPAQMKADTLWLVEAYRLGLYLSDIAWGDASNLFKHPRTCDIADQLQRSTWRISSTIAEGYSRDTGKGRSMYYEYALGSARESRDWYYKSRHVLPPQTIAHRIDLCTQLIRLTLTMISTERRRNRRVSDAD